jgi:AraC-like DNA-binding protein
VTYELLPIVLLSVLSGVTLLYRTLELFEVVSWCFAGYYISQLIRYIYWFSKHYHACTLRLENFFTEQESLRLKWVKTGFVLALLIGVLSLVKVFYVNNPWMTIAFDTIYPLFYVYFGIRLTNYVYVYHEIAPALDDTLVESGAVDYVTMFETAINKWINRKGFTESKITIARLASSIGSNRTYLSRYLNTRYQKSFSAWINELRIEEAKRLMKAHPEKSLGEVSLLTGYSDKSNFSRQFKKLTGQGAKSWRENLN